MNSDHTSSEDESVIEALKEATDENFLKESFFHKPFSKCVEKKGIKLKVTYKNVEVLRTF